MNYFKLHFVFIGVLFLAYFQPLAAQEKTPAPDKRLRLKKSQLELFSRLSSIIDSIEIKAVATEEPETGKTPVISDLYWDTEKFNPFPQANFKTPFQIVFSDSTYASPIDRKKVVTSRYGWRWGRAHHGIDIDLISGDSVRAIFKGKVRYVGYHGGHGRAVIVRHENGLETVYAHLSKQLVKVNDSVSKGMVIGKGGTSGKVTGSHLHLEVLYKGQSINPEYLFEFNEENRIKEQEVWVTQRWVTPLRHIAARKSRGKTYTTIEEALAAKEDFKEIYVIRKGDTLWKIARKHRMSVSQICRLNSIRKNKTLRIGQRLYLN